MTLEEPKSYGMLAQFQDPETLVKASTAAYRDGFRDLDAYTPYPVEELADAIGFKHDSIALITLVGGLIGGIGAFGMQWYCNVVDYPINVAGRPDFSWPAFIPVTFELTVLGAALFGAFGMLACNRLPKLWNPLFGQTSFARASRDRFFLCISSKDPKYQPERIRELMDPFKPLTLEEVPLVEE